MPLIWAYNIIQTDAALSVFPYIFLYSLIYHRVRDIFPDFEN